MNIQFLNHACFVVEHEDTVLLCDPYLSGTAFNDGWDLIVEDVHYEFDPAKKNFIYFSHEHPDHFSVGFLKNIDKEKRKSISIVYQETRDGRVKKFCEKMGYGFVEIPDKKSYNMSKDFVISIGQVPFYDSWAAIKVAGKMIVNANDCILETPDRVEDIKSLVGKCDILFTQFSYANWVEGGEANSQMRRALAEEKLRRVKMQSEVLSPKFIVPFASMVRFCHTENKYMNDSINTPEETVEFIDSKTRAKAHLMMPYEDWDGETGKDNSEAILYWKEAYEKALVRPLIAPKEQVSEAELYESAAKMYRRVKSKNSWLLIQLLSRAGVLPKLSLYCSDANKRFVFSWHGGLVETKTNHNDPDELELSTRSLKFVFDFDYGVDTLNVNARFNGKKSSKKKMIRCFSVLALNNTGRYITVTNTTKMVLDVSFLKQGLKTVGLIK